MGDAALPFPVAEQGGSRLKAGGGLRSGLPPDVVSLSARGSRAQEVARLESLCEARTKELNLANMQLKAGLQAFDAVTCLLNYCTNQVSVSNTQGTDFPIVLICFTFVQCACFVLYSTSVRMDLVKSPEVTLCGWLTGL